MIDHPFGGGIGLVNPQNIYPYRPLASQKIVRYYLFALLRKLLVALFQVGALIRTARQDVNGAGFELRIHACIGKRGLRLRFDEHAWRIDTQPGAAVQITACPEAKRSLPGKATAVGPLRWLF